MAILVATVVTLAAALPGVSADGGGDNNKDMAQRQDQDQDQEQALSIPDKAELKYSNLGSHLDQLVTDVEDGETTAKDAAAGASMHREESVAVTIYLTGNVADMVQFLVDSGGDPRNVGEDYIEAYVPVTLLGQVSEKPGVIRVREIIPPQPGQSAQRVAGHGPAAHLSEAWNQAGYSGQGIKVGIIDGHPAFNGFTGLMGTELPATVQARCYTDIGLFTQNLADCEDAEDGGNHGTLVAEAVVDIAPEASLYIANPTSKGDISNAVDWMVSEGVKVVVWSESYIFDGPGDGTSPFSDSPLRTVDRAVAGGVVWVNSAGNHARRTWFARAPFLDRDGDGFIEFVGGDEVNNMTLQAGGKIRVQLRWDDSWGGASTNLDLGIQDTTGIVAVSVDPQSGGAGHFPMEFIAANVLSSDVGVVVEHVSGSVPDWIQLVVWDVPSILHYTKNGSIGNPAESANLGMLAVGAAHWDDVRAIEPYSSRGPTPDGQDKPDIVGADCGATALAPLDDYNSGFCGTSQAAPHVAGLAALVRQRFPSYTPTQVASYLKDNAEQRQSPDPNYTWGHGFAKLPPPDGTPARLAAPSNAFTRNPAADFNTLDGAFNWAPAGIWSNGETMWVADWIGEKIYAYDMATKSRLPGKDFDSLEAAGNTWPEGIWSDGTTMWVADYFLGDKIYAYDMATKAQVPGKDFNTLIAAGNQSPLGIWSDGTTMWVADSSDDKVYAYDMATKARVPGKDFNTLKAARNVSPGGIWSDGTTMWIADDNRDKIYAYDMETKERVPGREFNTLEAVGNEEPDGIWSDGTTMWVADWIENKIYAYRMPQAQAVESAADREALIALYNATGGANWTNNDNWLTNAPIGQWHGVTTDANGRGTELNLTSNQLKGEIPPELGSLANVKALALGGNELTGPIPTWLGGLTSLEELHLWGNELAGEIPAELGNLTDLERLWLNDNQLTGEIPAGLGSLANLVELDLTDNQLTGTIPAELGSLANLEELWLSENQLTGEIPVELGSPSNLVQLVLWGNELTGEIPNELGSLSNLERLSLSDNQLSGEIPPQLGSLANLKELVLWGNRLSGEIPTELDSLTGLEILALGRNELTGTIPAELGSLTNLEVLDLSANQLTGTIPTWLANLANLEGLYLLGNELTGTIPAELGSLANLIELWLSGNQLTGEIPAELGSLANLEMLSLLGNELTGTIPAELGSLANLERLSLSGNQLTGEIPAELGSLTSLVELWLSNNQLTGGIPPELGSLANLEVLSLRDNQLTGEIPPELGSLANLAELYLLGNELTGTIPTELGGLANLGGLYLSSNQLTGEIPAELGSLANLFELRLSNNQLTGEIPSELGNLTNLTVLHLAGNQLTGCVPASLQDVADNDFVQLGLPFCPSGDPLVAKYDTNGDGAIDIGELFTAIDDYFAGEIGIGELFTLIDLYFAGPN